MQSEIEVPTMKFLSLLFVLIFAYITFQSEAYSLFKAFIAINEYLTSPGSSL